MHTSNNNLTTQPNNQPSSNNLHLDLYALSLNSELQVTQSNSEQIKLQHCHPSDSDSTSTSHHQPSISALSTNNDLAYLSDSNPSNNLFHQQPLDENPPDFSLPRAHSPPPRPSQEILRDISTLALNARITEVALSVQEVALALFQVQELRHSNASSNTESNRFPSPQTSPSILASDRAGGSSLTPVDRALIRLDKKVQTTSHEFSQLEALISSHCKQDEGTNSGESLLLNERFNTILEEWQQIQADTQILKDELKEDKWLVVFRAVSGQAEEMMLSLEKVLTVSQEFVREAFKRTRSSRTLSNSHHSSSNHSHHQIRENRESLGSSTSSLDRYETDELLKSHHALSKNFHAKNKHYVPSCQRVLGILSKGIKSRSTKNGEVLRRYADMNVRFTTIQEMIEKTELDLLTVEKLLKQQSATILSDPITSSPHCSIQVDDFSHLQPPTNNVTPGTPSSSSDSKTRKALSSMSNYIMSTSPKFFGKQPNNGISNSISPFKKLASKFTSSAASVSSQPSSISSVMTPPTLTASTLHRTVSSQQQHPLRSMRSGLVVKRNPSLNHASSRQVVSEERPGPSNVLLPEQQLRTRPNSRQVYHHHLHTPSSEKPRWNISLKRIEDTPSSSSLSHNLNSSTRRASHNLSTSHSRMIGGGMRASTPSMMHILARQNQQQQGSGGGGPERPGSVAGRSEASCMTTLSTSMYRSRPPSRHSRIPAPLWDPSMQAQRARSKGSLDLQEVVRSESGTPNAARHSSHYRPSTSMGTMRNGVFSPTSSDMEKMPTRKPSQTRTGSQQPPQHTRRVSRNSLEPNQGMSTHEQLESLIETLELEEKVNVQDPLDTIIHRKCKEQSTKILARRIDPHQIKNNFKPTTTTGDQARYSFWFIGIGRSYEEKSVICKLVEACSPNNSTNKNSPNNYSNLYRNKNLKVLVKSKTGWLDIDTFFKLSTTAS